MLSPLEQALTAMGYRRPLPDRPHVWAKPFGYSVLCCDTQTRLLWQTFLGADGELHGWTSAEIPADAGSAIDEIKYFEEWKARNNFDCGWPSTFHFIDQAAWAELFLDGPHAKGGDDA
jgi:hypothetical protein